jgi:LCP family protein required for cell wall assembly
MYGRHSTADDGNERARGGRSAGYPGRSSRRRPPPQPGDLSLGRLVSRLGYFLTCILAGLALVIAGFSYMTVQAVDSIGSSHAIPSGPSIGPQNILLMGLESRTFWSGTILPPRILAKLHAGSYQAVENGTGGNDTNTLILIHIFAGGKRAVGFSIPRDDWVQFADTIGPQQTGKIDQAYGVSMFFKEQELAQKNAADHLNLSKNRIAFIGNEAGQAAAVATVENLTGVHIDHFAAINLYGFYELAKVMGGVEVCLNHAVHDQNSGANFHAGYQHLDASQALAFVRQRDGLPNGDLDRTHRQQAFIDSVMHQLRTEGVLSDAFKVQALLSVAKKYVITDAGWNLLEFVGQMHALTSAGLVFHTLPIVGYQTIDGQDANVVNPAYIKQIVHAAFYAPPAPRHLRSSAASRRVIAENRSTTVDVFNGAGVQGIAHRVSEALVGEGYRAGQIGNTSPRSTTEVLYGAGAAAGGRRIAKLFGSTAVPSTAVPAHQVEVLLGSNAKVPSASATDAAADSGPSPPPSPSTVIPTTGPQGGAVTAKDGIPCVN